MSESNDWSLLGIAPTAELAAIKKAYAQRLRVTRPEDDAQAYQRLREAYERVQQWARWRAEEAVEPPVALSAPDAAAAFDLPAGAASQQDAEEDAEEVEEHSLDQEAQALQDWVETLGPKLPGSADAAADWAQIQERLHAVPLALQAWASILFADLVIATPGLPQALLVELQRHFGWLDDYRAAASLGAARLQSLKEALDLRGAFPISDPEQLRQLAPLIHLQQLRQRARDMAAFWFAARLGDPLLQLLLRPEVKRLPHFDPSKGEGVPSGWLVFWAGVARASVLATLTAVLLWPQQAWELAVELGAWHSGHDHPLTLLLRWVLLGAVPEGLGIVGLLGLWLLSRPAAMGSWLLSQNLGMGGEAQRRWDHPRLMSHGAAATACLLIVGLAVDRADLADDVKWLVLGALLLWVLGACRLYQRSLSGPLSLPFRPVLHTLALADVYGYKFAMTPAAVAALLAVADPAAGPGALLLAWLFTLVTLAWIQRRLALSALREMHE